MCLAGTAPAPFPGWRRCTACGSDTAEADYDKAYYPPDYSQLSAERCGGIEACRIECRSNAEWFDHSPVPEKTFLDVGCGDGAMLDVMASRGWSVHGFDVNKPHYHGSHITVGFVFTRWLFPRRYGAICAREVIEHVPWPHLLLHEMHGACLPGGLVQVQTPAPSHAFNATTYALAHLFVASPQGMKLMLAQANLEILDEKHWIHATHGNGQAYLCRAKG